LASRINESVKARRIPVYARVTSSIAPKGKIDEIQKLLSETLLPGSKKQKGYKGLLSLINPETGEHILISLWDAKEDIEAFGKASYLLQSRKLAETLGSKFTGTKVYTVGIKD
jgi:hypothetical protein